jgi:tripartite-type tricarboxylate transporter receptor subunit TctC
MPIRRQLVAAATVILATVMPIAMAQPVLDKPVRIVVGFPPGGAADSVARMLAEQLQGSYANTVIVDNKPGAGGRLGAQFIKDSAADGSQILLTPASILTIYPHVYKKLAYDAMADFTPVGSVAKVTFAFSASAAIPASVKTLSDYAQWAKANPKDANFGSPAAGATPHFVGTMLGRASGAQLNHIPYKGGAPLVTDLLGGQVQSGVNVLPEVLPHATSGKLRILAVSGVKRSRFLPNVPTFAESGFKGIEAEEYFAVFVPSKTPPETVAKLNEAIRNALKSKRMADGLEKLSFDAGGGSVADFKEVVQSEFRRWSSIVKASGFSSDD